MLGGLVTGGEPLGPDLGRGPARLLAPAEVAAPAGAARALAVHADAAEPDTIFAAGWDADVAVVCRGLRIAADGGRALLVVTC